jgi:hypothetical protein
MRLRLLAAGLTLLAVTACGGPSNNSDTTPNEAGRAHGVSSAPHSEDGSSGGKSVGSKVDMDLPAWSEKSPDGGDPAQAPAKHHVGQTFSGDNAGKDITTGTFVKLPEPGAGMLYRFACNDTAMDTGRYFSTNAGEVDGNGEPTYYATAAAHNEREGAYYFDWGWLANKLKYNQDGGFIRLSGDCKWEVKIIYQTM